MTKTDDKPISKQALYQIASLHSRTAIDRLVELLHSKNDNVALGACRVLLNKTIPDLNKVEFKEDAQPEGEKISDEDLEAKIASLLATFKTAEHTSIKSE